MYTQFTQASLAAEIAAALQDQNFTFWKQAEIFVAINEALLYWGALTAYWRERGTFIIRPTDPYPIYDMNAQFPTLRTRALTYDTYCAWLQWSLSEYAAGFNGTNTSAQFGTDSGNSADYLIRAVQRARNQFVIDAKYPSSILNGVSGPPPPQGRLMLDESVVVLERLWWTDVVTGRIQPLRISDPWAANSSAYLGNLTPGVPYSYSTLPTRPHEIELYPAPANPGQMLILCGQTDSTTPISSLALGLPDEYAPYIKYVALHALLTAPNEAADPYRAAYCLERIKQILAAVELQRSLVYAECEGIPVVMDTISALDAERPNWQIQSGPPRYIGCSFDQLAIAPGKPRRAYSIAVDLVRSAPLPTSPTDPIQVGREEIGYIVDYCKHVLSFKLGGTEFGATFPLHDNFLAGAAQRNEMLANKARYLVPLMGQPRRDDDTQRPS